MSDLGFDGRVAIVTGAGNGLGRAHALLLASRGASVVVNDLGGSVDGVGASAGPAKTVVEEIEALGGEAVADTSSVATVDGGVAIVQTAVEAFGGVDIVVNNAGILRDKSFLNLTPELLDPVLDVHLRGAFFVTRPAWGLMRDKGHGRIINTTSPAGIFGNFGQANYGAAKMGLVGLTRVLAQEGAKYNIKVNAISPAAYTRMTTTVRRPAEESREASAERLIQALDPGLVSPLIVFLAHEDCPATGKVFMVGGGRVAEIFIGETLGYFDRDLSPEAVRDNWATITNRDGYVVPVNIQEETALLLKHLS